jgi:hypothetical protein
MESYMSTSHRLLLSVLSVMLLSLLAVGCSRAPVVQYHNLKLVSSLRTALSARNTEWLDGTGDAVEARRSAGEMDEAECAHFNALIEAARRGEWQQAERDCYEFEVAQLSRRRDAPKQSDDHKH